MGTGLGPESYAIIEQGRIGQILSSKPHDRRAIIEEAAGITKFKTQKRLAEARLEDAKLNLNRINDIFDEVTRQMNSLKRQAAKAERYAKLRDEMRAKLRIVLASKFVALDLQLAEVDVRLSGLAEEIDCKIRCARRKRVRAWLADATWILDRTRDARNHRAAHHHHARIRPRRRAPPAQPRALRRIRRPHRFSHGGYCGNGTTSNFPPRRAGS